MFRAETVHRGGTIFGMDDRSKQIDVIVSHDAAPVLEAFEPYIVAVENVMAGISVKSELGRSTLVDALENLASIPSSIRKSLH